MTLFSKIAFCQDVSSEFIRVSSDKWYFETTNSLTPFVPFGANYYDPASWDTSVVWDNQQFIAPHVIGKFDSVRTRRHFTQLQDIGINIIRIFLSVKKFEPTLYQLDKLSFQKLDKIIELAKEHEIRIIFDLVEVWEGTPYWMSWDPYADETTIQGLEFLVSAFGERYANEATIFAWDLNNEPHDRWSDGIMDPLWIEWVHQKYIAENNVQLAWDDYPRSGETWQNIVVPQESEKKIRDQRLFDFQLFREDIAFKWTKRLVIALRNKDRNHLITIGFIQWSCPLKNSGETLSSYPAFNPQKIAPLLDYMSIHGYNWWDNNVGTYLQGLLRYCYENTPVVLEEFEYKTSTINETINSASGWLAWASYQGPYDPDPEAFLFDINENITNSGKDFQQKALSITNQIPIRTEDASTIDVDLKTLLTNTESMDSLYNHYVETQNNITGPLGFSIVNYYPPVSVLEEQGPLPKFFELMQNYPNPFNPTTKIKYSIPSNVKREMSIVGSRHASTLHLKVYDILGIEVATLVNEEKSAGIYEVMWNAGDLPSGVYFYKIQVYSEGSGAGNFIATKKMLLLK